MTQKYLKNKRITSWRAIYKILQKWKKDFVILLEKESKSFILEKKEDILDVFLWGIENDLPDYFDATLPWVMKMWASRNIKRYADLLPDNYKLDFDLPTAPAVKYLDDLRDLHLSDRDGSTLKTTRDEVRKIISDGVAVWDSYSTIAKRIEEVDPFVFSKTRAKLIAVNEVGRAYGWADHQPWKELSGKYIMEKKWNCHIDGKERDTHRENDLKWWIPFDDIWEATWDEYAPSYEINCRCNSTDRIIGIKTANGLLDTKEMSLLQIIELSQKNSFCNCKNQV